MRLIKSTLLATFPNITGAVTPTHTQINQLTTNTFTGTATFDGGSVITGTTGYAAFPYVTLGNAPSASMHATTKTYVDTADALKADKTITVTGTGGLTGGGAISSNQTISIATTSNGYGTRTVSASSPSGGSNGDVWYKTT
jgi:hypothetical protein